MAVPAGVICAFDGSVLNIPANWSRVTLFDNLHVQGTAAGVNPGATGGSLSHTHSDTHTHTIQAHSHATVNVGIAAGGSGTGSVGTTTTVLYSGADHVHAVPVLASTAGTSSAANVGFTATVAEAGYYAVIWLQAASQQPGLPIGALAYWNSATLPTGWTQVPGSQGRFLKGAAPGASGGAAGGTTGGATHTHTAQPHTHTDAGHTHPANASGNATTQVNSGSTALSTVADHSHATTFATGFAVADVQTALPSDTGTMDPPFTMLTVIKNGNAAADAPTNLICLWLGLLSAIPAGWKLCDGTLGTPDLRGKFVKGTTLLADFGTTGGAQGHSHTFTGLSHVHNDVGHTHQFLVALTTTATTTTGSGIILGQLPSNTHVHGVGATGPSSLTSGEFSGTVPVVASTADTRPPFINVAFIQYQPSITIAVTAPTANQVLTTTTPTITWTVSVGTQANYRVVIYASDGSTVVYDSGTVTSATLSAAIPSGYLANNATYQVQVTVNTTAPAYGSSAVTTFSVQLAGMAGPAGLSLTKQGGT